MGRPRRERVNPYAARPSDRRANRLLQDEAARSAGLPNRRIRLSDGERATVSVRPRLHTRSYTAYIVMEWTTAGGKQRSLSLSAEVPGDRTRQVMHGWQLIAQWGLLDEMRHEDFKDLPR